MPNTKKTQWSTWMTDTEALRASFNVADPHEASLAKFIRSVQKEAVRVQSDRDRG